SAAVATAPLANFSTPKSLGQRIGKVKGKPTGQSLSLFSTAPIAAGDGLCFIAPDGHLQGFRVNRVDELGRIFPATPTCLALLREGTVIYRNHDATFSRQLARPTADRRIHATWTLTEAPTYQPSHVAITITATSQPLPHPRQEPQPLPPFRQAPQPLSHPRQAPHPLPPFRQVSATSTFTVPAETARTPQAPAIIRQLTRLGDTPFATNEADIRIDLPSNPFIPASLLGNMRRQLCRDLQEQLLLATTPPPAPSTTPPPPPSTTPPPAPPQAATTSPAPTATTSPAITSSAPTSTPPPVAFPLSSIGRAASAPTSPLASAPSPPLAPSRPLMTCRYCLRRELGACLRTEGAPLLPPHVALRMSDGRTLPLRFDCQRCQMLVMAPGQ
ncbi:MAG: DUF3656 domain-containing protein, partial [Bacteroidaceae bacterium]|nr:DUF3656 domain-containing protein [Bacteroidaceae bacterium]